MQFVILIGGQGTRLGHLTQSIPKPLLPVKNIPFLKNLIQWAMFSGGTDIVLLSGYLYDKVEAFTKKMIQHGYPVRLIKEENILGTGGALVNAYDVLEDAFILLNGDSWFAINPKDIYDTLIVKKYKCVLALRRLDDTSFSGLVETEGQEVTLFKERGGAYSGYINSGISALKKEALNQYLNAETPLSLEQNIYPELVEKRVVMALEYDRYFIDIGLPSTYELAQEEFPIEFHKYMLEN
jgi:NDP-sugar pyrophosphorylase family protein